MATIVNINIEDADSVQQVPCEAENLSLLKTSMEGSTVIELNQINGVLTKHSKESSKDFMLLHEAAKTGNVEILKQLLLDKADPTKLDGEKRTPLHWACCFVEKKAEVQTTALAMVKEILQSAKANGSPKLVDYKDYKRQTALELAAKHGNALLIMELLNAGANPSYNKKNHVMPQIYQKMSDVLISAYDQSVTTVEVGNETNVEDDDGKLDARKDDEDDVGETSDSKIKWTFDFVTIVGLPNPKVSSSFPETEWLSQCDKLGSDKKNEIFMHPLVRMFLHLKWKKIRFLLWLSVLYHIAWLILYTYFNVDLYLAHCPFTASDERNDTYNEMPSVENHLTLKESESMSHNRALDITGVITYCDLWDHYTRLNSELWLLFVMTVTIAVKEVYEMYSSRGLSYFKQLENIGQWAVVVIVILASIPIFRVDDNWGVGIYEWQYQASSFGIMLACFLILSQIGKIPSLGIYILILAKVMKSFIMFIITFATILVAFMISFQILMPEKTQFRDNPWGFVRILVMMTGEVNYDDLFYSEDANSQLPFPISTKFLFAAFIAIVTIILFNLLIGLTVSDIQGLQSGAELNSLSIQVEEIYGMEKFMTSDSFQNILKCIGKQNWIEHFRVTRRKNGAIASAKVEVLEENIPKHLLHILGRLVWRNEFRLIKDGKKKSMSNRFMNRIKPKGMGPGPRFWQRDQKINQL